MEHTHKCDGCGKVFECDEVPFLDQDADGYTREFRDCDNYSKHFCPECVAADEEASKDEYDYACEDSGHED